MFPPFSLRNRCDFRGAQYVENESIAELLGKVLDAHAMFV
jgi:hypothetical protein